MIGGERDLNPGRVAFTRFSRPVRSAARHLSVQMVAMMPGNLAFNSPVRAILFSDEFASKTMIMGPGKYKNQHIKLPSWQEALSIPFNVSDRTGTKQIGRLPNVFYSKTACSFTGL